ncbi:MAG: hypothetical protein Udaeo_15740 [Candidatus Udaeobacter sp.]|nr:MAG: hypothetical protein Udaeo_15740 [Candidatus Udaeobacter sp.]
MSRGSIRAVATIANSEVNIEIAPNEMSFRIWNSCWKENCAMKIELPISNSPNTSST